MYWLYNIYYIKHRHHFKIRNTKRYRKAVRQIKKLYFLDTKLYISTSHAKERRKLFSFPKSVQGKEIKRTASQSQSMQTTLRIETQHLPWLWHQQGHHFSRGIGLLPLAQHERPCAEQSLHAAGNKDHWFIKKPTNSYEWRIITMCLSLVKFSHLARGLKALWKGIIIL